MLQDDRQKEADDVANQKLEQEVRDAAKRKIQDEESMKDEKRRLEQEALKRKTQEDNAAAPNRQDDQELAKQKKQEVEDAEAARKRRKDEEAAAKQQQDDQELAKQKKRKEEEDAAAVEKRQTNEEDEAGGQQQQVGQEVAKRQKLGKGVGEKNKPPTANDETDERDEKVTGRGLMRLMRLRPKAKAQSKEKEKEPGPEAKREMHENLMMAAAEGQTKMALLHAVTASAVEAWKLTNELTKVLEMKENLKMFKEDKDGSPSAVQWAQHAPEMPIGLKNPLPMLVVTMSNVATLSSVYVPVPLPRPPPVQEMKDIGQEWPQEGCAEPTWTNQEWEEWLEQYGDCEEAYDKEYEGEWTDEDWYQQQQMMAAESWQKKEPQYVPPPLKSQYVPPPFKSQDGKPIYPKIRPKRKEEDEPHQVDD